MEILFLQTGGTIDKAYPKPTGGYAFEISEPAAERILKNAKPAFEYEIVTVCRKDSQDITETDRKAIREVVVKAKQNKIVITHGTDTMAQTAKTLEGIPEKTIVLTGALLPERFKGSDAEFNLGLAIGAVQTLAAGVYIVMSGRIFKPNACKRDEKTGKFVEI